MDSIRDEGDKLDDMGYLLSVYTGLAVFGADSLCDMHTSLAQGMGLLHLCICMARIRRVGIDWVLPSSALLARRKRWYEY